MGDIHKRVLARDYLKGLSPKDFANEAADILGDVNYVHPFREGNGRTQVNYLKQLGQRAGHQIDLTKLDRTTWMNASREAHAGRYHAMADWIETALGRRRERARSDKCRDRRER